MMCDPQPWPGPKDTAEGADVSLRPGAATQLLALRQLPRCANRRSVDFPGSRDELQTNINFQSQPLPCAKKCTGTSRGPLAAMQQMRPPSTSTPLDIPGSALRQLHDTGDFLNSTARPFNPASPLMASCSSLPRRNLRASVDETAYDAGYLKTRQASETMVVMAMVTTDVIQVQAEYTGRKLHHTDSGFNMTPEVKSSAAGAAPRACTSGPRGSHRHHQQLKLQKQGGELPVSQTFLVNTPDQDPDLFYCASNSITTSYDTCKYWGFGVDMQRARMKARYAAVELADELLYLSTAPSVNGGTSGRRSGGWCEGLDSGSIGGDGGGDGDGAGVTRGKVPLFWRLLLRLFMNRSQSGGRARGGARVRCTDGNVASGHDRRILHGTGSCGIPLGSGPSATGGKRLLATHITPNQPRSSLSWPSIKGSSNLVQIWSRYIGTAFRTPSCRTAAPGSGGSGPGVMHFASLSGMEFATDKDGSSGDTGCINAFAGRTIARVSAAAAAEFVAKPCEQYLRKPLISGAGLYRI